MEYPERYTGTGYTINGITHSLRLAEPAHNCESCRRCLEFHGDLIKLFREAIDLLKQMELAIPPDYLPSWDPWPPYQAYDNTTADDKWPFKLITS